jgi:hypothetical protein
MIPVRHSAPSVDDGEQIACRGINPPAAWFATPGSGSRQVGYSEAMPECELKAESLMYVAKSRSRQSVGVAADASPLYTDR